MLNVQSTIAAPPPAIRREDYRPPDWLVSDIALDFDLDPAKTRVRARLEVHRNGNHDRPLKLDGEELTPLAVKVDGAELRPGEWRMEGGALILDLPGIGHVVETEVEIAPEKNTQLMGLYSSGGILCTQCEAEGFRRITFFPDRPDILSRYVVRMRADKTRFPVLLSNGDHVEGGELPGGRHWAEWRDPFPKPCYLFALVAADLAVNRASFTTMSGRKVDLGIWVRAADLAKTEHAMAALKESMAWDERVYGREYDLSTFNIVAVSDFNFGAMENKGLNIFNSRYILADPETATDADFDAVAAVVAHEYFHNWSGDRVTCRDWFQLSLKEGFTVFRDQSFSADQGSAAVKRIEDVRTLRAIQFPEDAGPLAHPVRPESYIEITNFYTATVYNKGAEVIRMMATLLGPERFRKGSDLYFERHDGQAVTCEDFVKAMEDASGVDLTQFRRWYSQAGTPVVTAKLTKAGGTATIDLAQKLPVTPGQGDKQPMHFPLRLRLFDHKSGKAITPDQMVEMRETRHQLRFEVGEADPVLSINRGFSAPITVESDRSAADLAFLSAKDDDPFARYEAMQQLALDTLLAAIRTGKADHRPVIDAVAATLEAPSLDAAFVAEAVLLPSTAFIGDHLEVIDPERVHAAREALRRDLGHELQDQWWNLYRSTAANRFELTPSAKGARRLRSVALGYLGATEADRAGDAASRQFDDADNMTDRLGALGVLVSGPWGDRRKDALTAFYERFRKDLLVIDKWFAAQALSARDDAVETVLALAQHGDFTLTNPNRARALIGSFAANQRAFHRADGAGYRFVADMILKLDKLNPQTAARLVAPFGRWRKFTPDRAAAMKAALERIVAVEDLSKDVFEQASKSLV